MNIKIKNGKYASEEAIQKLEAELGCPLSVSFRTFVGVHDGAKPEPNTFTVKENINGGVNRFIPVNNILKERQSIENLPSKAYPVAWAECGNYIFVDEGRRGEVYFWDHEEPEKIIKIGDSFDVFLSLLRPFDVKSIKLNPKQVKRVWINPNFLKHREE